jgi:hypothetical protein
VVTRYTLSVMDGLALNWLAWGDEEQARRVLEMTARAAMGLVRPR